MPIKNWTKDRLARKSDNQRRWSHKPRNVIKARNYMRTYNRSYIISRRTKILASKYGRHVAAAYSSYASKPGANLKIRITFIKDLCLPPLLQSSSANIKERIHLLNDISSSPFGNIGWSCRKCSTHSTNQAFFDIDHILPRHKSGSSSRNNLQILCPNCHRLKSLDEVTAWRSGLKGEGVPLINGPVKGAAPTPTGCGDGRPLKEIPSEDLQIPLSL